jgi:hypothetical protein
MDKKSLVNISWALILASTATGFQLYSGQQNLEGEQKNYIISAAVLNAISLALLSAITFNIVSIDGNFLEINALLLSLSLTVASLGLWWFVYNDRIVDRYDSLLLTSTITTTIAVVFLTIAYLDDNQETGKKIPSIEKNMKEETQRKETNSKRSPPRRSVKKGTNSKRSPPRRSVEKAIQENNAFS